MLTVTKPGESTDGVMVSVAALEASPTGKTTGNEAAMYRCKFPCT